MTSPPLVSAREGFSDDAVSSLWKSMEAVAEVPLCPADDGDDQVPGEALDVPVQLEELSPTL